MTKKAKRRPLFQRLKQGLTEGVEFSKHGITRRGLAMSKYDNYWRSQLGEVRKLLEEAYQRGESSELDVTSLNTNGDRDDWSGSATISVRATRKASMAHVRSLQKLILENGLLDEYGNATF